MESTLSLTLTQIQAKLGTYAGWGRGAAYSETAWTTSQQAVLDDATQSGYRRFLFPPPQEGSRESYAWCFLRPVANLILPSGASSVPLPDDFGGIEGEVTLQPSSGVMWFGVQVCNPGEVDARYSLLPDATGKPQMVAIRWEKGTTSVSGQRADLYFWPAADTEYPIRLTYYVLPDFMDAAKMPYALGGMAHSETLLESCLAVLEERLDDGSGVHAQAFASRLTASISIDRRSKAQVLGMNLDRSDNPTNWRQGWNHIQNPIGINGVVYAFLAGFLALAAVLGGAC